MIAIRRREILFYIALAAAGGLVMAGIEFLAPVINAGPNLGVMFYFLLLMPAITIVSSVRLCDVGPGMLLAMIGNTLGATIGCGLTYLLQGMTFVKDLDQPVLAVVVITTVLYVILAAVVGIVVETRQYNKWRRRDFCPKCGYSRVGLPTNRCPECGHVEKSIADDE